MVARICLFLCSLCLSVPAMAEWHRAESEHYVVHADMSQADLQQVTQTLEDFNRVLRELIPLRIEPGQKLQIYLTTDYRRMSRIRGMSVAGIPVYSPEFVMAFTYLNLADPENIRHDGAFFYAAGWHLEQAFLQPSPPWLLSGVPQFFSTAFRDKDGRFILGAPSSRYPPTKSISAKDLETTLSYKTTPDSQGRFNRFFDVAGVLAAPLMLEPAYDGAIERYIGAYSSGQTMEQAAATLGDREVLLEDIRQRSSMLRPLLPVLELAPVPPANITIRPLRKDETALIDLRFERTRERLRKRASQQLSALTRKMPDGALVWYEYAAAELARVQNSEFGGDPLFRGFGFANGELIVTANRYPDAEAWRAVNRALAIDPDMAEARRLRAEILLNRLVREGEEADPARYEEVRQLLAPLARDPRRQPLAAALYHQSYIEQGLEPTTQAFEQLGEAFRTNASVIDLRYAYAVALSRLGRVDEARSLLTSLLNSPRFAEAAARALDAAP